MGDLVLLVDVGNTLIDNDAVKRDLAARIEGLLGGVGAELFWSAYGPVRSEQDVPLAASRARRTCPG